MNNFLSFIAHQENTKIIFRKVGKPAIIYYKASFRGKSVFYVINVTKNALHGNCTDLFLHTEIRVNKHHDGVEKGAWILEKSKLV